MITFDAINVNVIDENSGIFTGVNTQCNWRAQNKDNSGFGRVTGNHNLVYFCTSTVIDPDTIDNPHHS